MIICQPTAQLMQCTGICIISDSMKSQIDQFFADCNLDFLFESFPTVFDLPAKLLKDFTATVFDKDVFETATFGAEIFTVFVTGPFGPLLGLVR